MSDSIDPALAAFFQEVKEQLDIDLQYFPDDPKFPIQSQPTEGMSKLKCVELLNFIRGQVDLRDNEIGKIVPAKTTGKFNINLSSACAKALTEVYSLSLFYNPKDEQPKRP